MARVRRTHLDKVRNGSAKPGETVSVRSLEREELSNPSAMKHETAASAAALRTRVAAKIRPAHTAARIRGGALRMRFATPPRQYDHWTSPFARIRRSIRECDIQTWDRLKDNKADKIEIEQRPRIMIMSVVKGEGKNEKIDTAGWRHILWSAYDHAASAGEVKSAARIRYGCDPRLLPGNMIMTSHHSTKSTEEECMKKMRRWYEIKANGSGAGTG
ncbi:hypothetical protein C8J57DRAFT_1236589 [Mycena rebaudengoi]|nr:hypothetical protein C8J57DRAFT_1236589 [Mycena rebaudengoi]